LRAECGVDQPAQARASDYPLFLAAWASGIVVGLAFLPVLTVVGPLLYLAGRVRGVRNEAPPSPTLVDSASPR
jgi:hypothetical protein